MATTIVWGPLTLQKCVLKDMQCEEVLTEDKMQVRYRKYTVAFSCYLHPTQNSYQITNAANGQVSNIPATATSTAQSIFFWMTKPRQYFRLDMDNQILLEVPTAANGRCDAMMGPICRNVNITQAVGAPGFSGNLAGGAGGHFLISGIFEVCTTQDIEDGVPKGSIQGYSFTCVNDVDGNTFRTTRTTQIIVHLRPEVIFTLADPRAEITADLVIIAALCKLPLRFRRVHARTEILTSQIDFMIMLVDRETPLPMGGLSPAVTFSPVHHYAAGWATPGAGAKAEGAFHAGLQIDINATYCETDDIIVPGRPDDHQGRSTQQAVIEQCFLWILNMGHALRGDQGRFVMYHEIVISIDYQQAQIAVSAKINMQKDGVGNPVGTAGIPFNLANWRLDNTGYLTDLSGAQIVYLDAEELTQINPGGPLKFALKNPGLGKGFIGSYTSGVLSRVLSGPIPQDNRQLPDGFARLCPQPEVPVPSPGDLPDAGGEGTDTTIIVVFVNEYTITNYTGIGLVADDQAYESTWQTTRYSTDTGNVVLPLGGTMPGYVGSGTPPTAVQVTLHSPVTQKAVTWGVQSIGNVPPKYPSINTGDPLDVYNRAVIKPAACIPVAVGRYAWTITGTYYFDRLETLEPGDDLTVGHLPITPATVWAWEEDRAEDGRLPGVA
jgi:hypothetical protein